jgi:hypothetical protein
MVIRMIFGRLNPGRAGYVFNTGNFHNLGGPSLESSREDQLVERRKWVLGDPIQPPRVDLLIPHEEGTVGPHKSLARANPCRTFYQVEGSYR